MSRSINGPGRGCAPYPLIPNAILLALGFECRCAKFVEARLDYAMNPVSVESFVSALRVAARRFVRRGAEVIGILDPFWTPARYVDRIPLVVFKRGSYAKCQGPRWGLYRVDDGVYLQVFSSITAPSADEVEEASERVKILSSMTRIRIVELEVAPRLLGLEKVGGLDAVLCACVGPSCSVVDTKDFVKSIALDTSSRYGNQKLVVAIGMPRIRFEECTYIWVPAPSPSYVEVLDCVASEVGPFGRCVVAVDSRYVDAETASPISMFSRNPIRAVLREVCREVAIEVADSDDECTSV
ncbi:MAG: hypothetical protein GXO32_03630 [Crenarchaeota archaeon]|nr:hypothetical protein [Thermoproteota archaeon]